jgi:CheY-like chemotaxis protein
MVAATGPEGLEVIAQARPALALVDIGLPRIGGYDLARQVRNRLGNQDTYLLVLTGYGRPMDRESARQAGFDERLVKAIFRVELECLLKQPMSPSPTPPGG